MLLGRVSERVEGLGELRGAIGSRILLCALRSICALYVPPTHTPLPATPSPVTLPPFPEPGKQPEHITKGYVPRLACARLPGSYINHYCANGGVVVPQFGYATDQQAIDVLQEAYGPSYKVVGVPGGTREVLLNAGNVHCITQQHVLGGI